jgi:adenylate cyclase
MPASAEYIFYVIVLLFTFYGVVRSFKAYGRSRDLKYLIILAALLVFSTDLWTRLYGTRVEAFLNRFRTVLVLLPLAAVFAYTYMEDRRKAAEAEKLRVKSYFEKYVSPAVIGRLLQQKKISLRGERRDMTVLFTDIRGFTSMSESMPATELVELLNKHYFEDITKIVLKHDGTVDKFIGDSVMALFGAPLAQKDHASSAVKAAVEIQRHFKQINRELARKGRAINVGIGLNCGEAVVGNIGSSKYMEYTAVGDVVNTASRLQALAEAGEIVVSDAVYKRVKDKVKVYGTRDVKVKGKKAAIRIHKVVV